MKKIILILILHCGYYVSAIADIATPLVSPSTAIVGQAITFSGISTCESVYLMPGDGGSGGLVPVNGGPNSYSTVYAYTAAGTYNFSLTEMGACQPATTPGTYNGTIIITSDGGTGGGTIGYSTNLQVQRIELYFDNKQPKITVDRNKKLHAFARINYTGTGLLRGYWEVDGRLFSNIYQHLTQGDSVLLAMPDLPYLPTYKSGVHKVRLVINTPAIAVSPTAFYFVRNIQNSDIQLMAPVNGSELDIASMQFSWERVGLSHHYTMSIIENGNSRPVYSASIKNTHYQMEGELAKQFLNSETDYQWQVEAFDKFNQSIASSEFSRFTIKASEGIVKNQVLLITEDNVKGKKADAKIENKYQLEPLQTFTLSSLNHRVSVFKTDKDITPLITQLKNETGVVDAQANFISRVMAEPRSKFQHISKILNFNMLHQNHSGKWINIAVIDTGVDTNHRDLKQNIKQHMNFINNDSYQNEIHGTAVAGIVAAGINGFGISGVAPQANLLAYRACRQLQANKATAECYSTSLAKALDAAILEKSHIVNMSFGATQTDPLLTRLIDQGSRRGIIFVAPVGNESSRRDLAFPASHSQVISVAGIDDNNKEFPNKMLTNLADVVSPSSQLFTTTPDNKHNFFDGTSMSSAIVSGLLALAIEKKPTLNRRNLPHKSMDLCEWQEHLLNIQICQ